MQDISLRALLAPFVLAVALAACGDGTSTTAGEAAGSGDAASSDRLGGLRIENPQVPELPWDFKMENIPYGDTADLVVRFSNQEGRPLQVLDVKPGCACTAATLIYRDASGEVVRTNVASARHDQAAMAVIPEDGELELVLSIDSRRSPVANQLKRVVVNVVTDSDTNPYPYVELLFMVDRTFDVVPPIVKLGEVASSAGGRGQADVVCRTLAGEKILGVLEEPEDLVVRIEDFSYMPIPMWRIVGTLLPGQSPGSHERVVKLRTSGPGGEGEGRPVEVHFQVEIAADLGPVPGAFAFSSGAPESEVQLLCRVPGLEVLPIDYTIEGEYGDRMRLAWEAINPSSEGKARLWRLRLSAPPELADAPLGGTVVVRFDDVQYPEVRVPYARAGGA